MPALMAPPDRKKAQRRENVVARKDELRQRDVLQNADEISSYYSQTIDDYLRWSPEGYMHFGLWRPWQNPLDRRTMLEGMNDLVFDSLKLNRPETARVADLGCGLGAVCRYGAARFPQHQWLGFSICKEQVSFGKSRQYPASVSLRQADYHSLPLDDRSIDGAFFIESLSHSHRPEVALQELVRVLRPGGRLVIVDGLLRRPLASTPGWFRTLHNAVCRSWALPHFHEREPLQEAARLAGFELEEARELGWQIAPCVSHTPLLVALHAVRLALAGTGSSWKRKHLIGCLLGVALGLCRRQFGYYALTMKRRDG